jgi:MFS family permease
MSFHNWDGRITADSTAPLTAAYTAGIVSDRLFTARFFTMFGFSFTVFLSVFQLLPAAPYHILDLGGSASVSGLFLGLLTYASAVSAPLTGTVGDRHGQRRVLIVVSLVLAAFSLVYAFLPGYGWMLGLVVVHGVFWSALLSASGAYMTSIIPAGRRGEGLGYWGLASVAAIGVAPPFGFWIYQFGWTALCLEVAALNSVMAFIAWRLPDDRASGAESERQKRRDKRLRESFVALIEWRVLALSVAIGLVSFGYGSLTSFSAMFADELGIAPRSLFLTAMAGRSAFSTSAPTSGAISLASRAIRSTRSPWVPSFS